MKIIKLEAENFKRLKAISITPDGNMVQLTGKNAQGKTSVLDAIWMALKVSDVKQDKPIRDGEETARIRLDLGEIIITRKFKIKDGETTTSIAVEKADGAKYPSPQSLIDSLLSSLTFDPLAFARMDAQAQVKAVRSLLPGVDFDGVAKANKADFEARTEINRVIRDLEGEIKAVPAAASHARVDKASLLQQLTEASEFNALIEKKKANREKAAEKIADFKKGILDMRGMIEKLQADEKQMTSDMLELSEKLAGAGPLDEPRDAAALSASIADADKANAMIDAFEAWQAKKDKLAGKKKESEAITKRMEDRNDTIANGVAAAKLPVSGLVLTEDGVILNNIPFNQASDAEALRTSCAIAMSLNPKLKVIRVRDGSLLDEDGMAILTEMAEKNDYQVWIERVDSSGSVGFVLEDGHIRGQEIKPVVEAPKHELVKAQAHQENML